MKIVNEPEKNPDTGEMEIMVKLEYEVVDLLKGAIAMYRGDVDDPKQIKLAAAIKDFLLECKGKLRPG